MGNNPHEQPSINIFYHLSTPLFKQFNYAQVNCNPDPRLSTRSRVTRLILTQGKCRVNLYLIELFKERWSNMLIEGCYNSIEKCLYKS